MAIFKCKMCGDNLEVSPDQTYGTCDSCGSTMTLPKIDDDQKVNLYNRANHFRRQNEFDKALAIYERMIGEDDSEAEAHWGAILCRFGIEYVEDPVTHQRVPTCHRASYDSILKDVDYLAALKSSGDVVAKRLYEEEAAYIAEVQKGIISISQKEKPYDVFICYKETAPSGSRTQDSTLAQDVYYQLTQEGYKVFFSRITLEDKLGQAYEPYIFAALNSAKVMVIIGTKPEYYSAVWVKNEWSRYLNLLKKDKSRLLIPCYRGMDAYDLPEELSMLQSQDMGKIGFIQDLIRGIKKVLVKEEAPVTKVVETVKVESSYSANGDALLKRVKLFLEDGEWDNAKEYCDKVLDMDAECAMAYVYTVCAKLKCKTVEGLALQDTRFLDDKDCQKAIRFGDSALKAQLEGYDKIIADRLEENRKAGIYSSALSLKNGGKYTDAIAKFQSIVEYKDGEAQISDCHERIKEGIYQEGLQLKNLALYKDAIEKFQSIKNFKDTKEQIAECNRLAELAAQEKAKADAEAARLAAENARLAEEQRLQAEKDAAVAKEKRKKLALIGAAVTGVVAIIAVYLLIIAPTMKYNEAKTLLETGDYDEAITCFTELGSYSDSADMMLEASYQKAIALLEAGDYDEATALFTELDSYSDSADMILEANYQEAMVLLEAGDYDEAITRFTALGSYSDSADMLLASNYNYALDLLNAGEYSRASALLEKLDNYSDSADMALEATYQLAMSLLEVGSYDQAIVYFEEIDNYSDSEDMVLEATYQKAIDLLENGENAAAAIEFVSVGDYKDATTYTEQLVPLWRESLAHSIAYGDYYAVALKSDGTVMTTASFTDDVFDWTDIVSISADNHIVGLKSNGTVVADNLAAGNNNDFGQCNVTGWRNIVAISAGNSHTVGLKSDGTVVAVGSNTYGQCDVSDWTDIVAVSANFWHTVGLKSDGTVVAVGENVDGECDVSLWTDIVAISAGSSHTVGLKSDGTVVSKGLSGVSSWTNIVAIATGYNCAVGLKSNGTVVSTGSLKNDISNWNNIVAISDSAYSNSLGGVIIGLTSDGTLLDNALNDQEISDWTDIKVYDN